MAILKSKKGLEIIVDDDKLKELARYKWNITPQGYVYTRIAKKLTFIHRYLTNCPSNMVVDHINMNKLDNRLSNLEIVTRSENSRRNAEAMYHAQEAREWKLDQLD